MLKRFLISARIIVLLTGPSLVMTSSIAIACTLFGAIGNSVDGGGCLIGKTRDRAERSEQVFIEVVPKTGFR